MFPLFRFLFVAVVVSTLALGGCSSKKDAAKETLDFSKTDAYAQQVFDTIVAGDFDAYLSRCLNPDDVGLDGQPLMRDYDKGKWPDNNRLRFDALLASIEREGGLETLRWVKPGQPLGYLKNQNEFVGNIYIEVTIGQEAKQMVLEIGSTLEAQDRGRLLMPDSGVVLKTWEYYKANVL